MIDTWNSMHSAAGFPDLVLVRPPAEATEVYKKFESKYLDQIPDFEVPPDIDALTDPER